MTNEQVPQGTTADVSADESFEAHEAAFLAGQQAEASDATDSAANKSEGKTAADSETEEDQEQDNEEQKTDEEPKAKGKGGFQRKIDKLTGKIRDLESQLLAGKAPAAQATTEETAAAAKAKPEASGFEKAKPKLEDFEGLEEFTEALTDWKADEREWKRDQATKETAAKKAADTLIEGWNARVSEVKSQHPDYDDVIEGVSDVPLSPAHQRLFLDSDDGARIAYDLAQDRDELTKFSKMHPLEAARYFGRLEAKSGSSAHTKSTPATRAPKPPATVGSRGTAAASSDTFDERLATDYEAWERARNAQLRKRLA